MSIKAIFNPRHSAVVFTTALFLVYCVLPLAIDALFVPNPYFVELASITAVACVALMCGFHLPLFDRQFKPKTLRIGLDANGFHIVVWTSFVLFLLVTFSTAGNIPIISAFLGAGTDELSLQRGEFLKARTGAEAALLYLSTFFVCALLPYSLACLFIEKSRHRFALMLLFLGFCISFLQKSLFLNVLVPLIYLASLHQGKMNKRIIWIVLASVGLLYGVSLLSFGGSAEFEVTNADVATVGDFFGAGYLPSGLLDHLLWRSVAVPMFTAADTLLVYSQQFNHQPLMGATSSFLAAITGQERIPLERLVFEQQWNWNDIANSNAVYITEAFVNFGWFGVVFFSLFVGQSLRWFAKSKDEAFRSLWMIYCIALFSSGLIGTLLSLGYSAVFLYCLVFKLTRKRAKSPRAGSAAGSTITPTSSEQPHG